MLVNLGGGFVWEKYPINKQGKYTVAIYFV